MLRHPGSGLVSSLPLVLLGSLPLNAVAGEFFFPVLTEDGSHWFSWFDPAYTERAVQPTEKLMALAEPPADLDATAEYELALEQGSLPQDAYGGSQMEVLAQLSKFYRNQGRYAEAFDRLERQYFLARITQGLHDPRHIPLLQELVDLALLKGDVQRSHELRHGLLNLQLRSFDDEDVRHTEALLSWAEWQLQRFLATYQDFALLSGPDADLRFNPHFVESDEYFRRALDNLASTGSTATEERKALLLAIRQWQTLHFAAFRRQRITAGFYHHQGSMMDLHGSGPALAVMSQLGHVTKMLRPSRSSGSYMEGPELELHVIQLLQLGDWQHSIGLPGAAGRSYEEAVALLRRSTLSSSRMLELLTPGLPVPDPEHWYYYKRHTATFRGYMDVEVSVDADGSPLTAVLLDPAAHETSAGKSLLQHIASSAFRPALDTDKAGQTFQLRYYHE